MLNRLHLKINRLSIEFDRNYGYAKRTGWTISYGGSILTQLQPWLVAAIWRALMARRIQLVDGC